MPHPIPDELMAHAIIEGRRNDFVDEAVIFDILEG